jgi:hypothetical protein
LRGTAEELENLREEKADAERKEKATAEIIRQQKESIVTLEAKYKDEQSLRKKYYNTIEARMLMMTSL